MGTNASRSSTEDEIGNAFEDIESRGTSSEMTNSQRTLIQMFSNNNFLSGKVEDIRIVNNLGSQRVGSSLYHGIFQDTECVFRCFVLEESDLEAYKEHVLRLSNLRHPHIISFYICVIDAPRYGLVAEYCKYGSLKNIINSFGSSIPISERLRFISEVTAAIKHLHELGVVHGELGVSHVLLNETFISKIKDFGIESTFREKSKKYGPMKREEGYYLAPELSKLNESIRATKESDVYALSILTYAIITTRSDPYECLNVLELDPTLSLKESRPDLTKMREALSFSCPDCPDLSKSLGGLMEKGWAKEPSERWTMEEFYQEISTIRKKFRKKLESQETVDGWREDLRKSLNEQIYRPNPPLFGLQKRPIGLDGLNRLGVDSQQQAIGFSSSSSSSPSTSPPKKLKSRSEQCKSEPKVLYLRRRDESDEDSEDFLLEDLTMKGLKKIICEWAKCEESKILRICKQSKGGGAVRRITKDGTVALLSHDVLLVVDFVED